MIISSIEEFMHAVNGLDFRYAKTYTKTYPHEYAIADNAKNDLVIIRALNRFIQEKAENSEIYWNKEYKVVFAGEHKYWQVGDWTETTIINRNWDYKNEDGTINCSVTKSKIGT